MATLLLRLQGPLQSWGDGSRFTQRKTRHEPTKSGVIGIIAAAMGFSREDELGIFDDLLFAVRVDKPGRLESDFQTAAKRKWNKETNSWERGKSKSDLMPTSNRLYLSDAVFVAALEGPLQKIQEFANALAAPAFPLYLGRRSCSPSMPILIGVDSERDLMSALAAVPWQAPRRYQSKFGEGPVELLVMRDVLPDDPEGLPKQLQRDIPVSYSQEHRQYIWRDVVRDSVMIEPIYKAQAKMISSQDHDPLSTIEGA